MKVEIDGIVAEVEEGATIIEVADRLSIPIPRFCYHKKLSVAANCRMCLVQVEKSNKTLPACATPVTDGMKVWTKSKEAIVSQKAVMEFLLINHPLDCPICDQGGECELQDISVEYGADSSRYTESKRVVQGSDLGSLIATDMTRCIQCTRCVRFGEEISGQRELGAVGRGEMMEISTCVKQNIDSEVSGNVIDLCPVGALTSKPFRFRARAWELQQHASIAAHDSFGSNLFLHVYNDAVLRVVPKDNEEINENWLSDRDRFSYEALTHDERLRKPLLLKHNNWNIAPWQEALKYALAGLNLCIENYGADQVGVLVSPNATLEELYLLQKFSRALGITNIDHRLRQLDFSAQEYAPLFPNFGIAINELEHQDCILLIGSNIHKEQPNAGLKLRKAVKKGAKVCVVNSVDYHFNFAVAEKSIVRPRDILASLESILKGKLFAKELQAAKKIHIILGQQALMHPHASKIMALCKKITESYPATMGYFSDGANAAGAWLVGCVPHRTIDGNVAAKHGKTARQMLETPLKCYVLFAIEPEFDSVFASHALETIKQADFVITFSAYESKSLLEISDVILPISQFSENAGTFINAEGRWQSFEPATAPYAESRPAWKILRVLANFAQINGFEYNNHNEITAEIRQQLKDIEKFPKWNFKENIVANPEDKARYDRISPIALYACDYTVRRARSLQQTKDAVPNPTVQLNAATAKQLKLNSHDMVRVQSGSISLKLAVEINDAIADDSVLIYQANMHTNTLPASFSSVEVQKC